MGQLPAVFSSRELDVCVRSWVSLTSFSGVQAANPLVSDHRSEQGSLPRKQAVPFFGLRQI